MNKTTSFHPALILVFWAKFLPVRLFRPVRLFIFCQNSTLYAYSESTLIRETRVDYSLDIYQDESFHPTSFHDPKF